MRGIFLSFLCCAVFAGRKSAWGLEALGEIVGIGESDGLGEEVAAVVVGLALVGIQTYQLAHHSCVYHMIVS